MTTKTLLASAVALSLLAGSAPARADEPPAAPPQYLAAAPAWQPMPLPLVRRSRGAFVGGIVLTSLGAAAALIGAASLMMRNNGQDSCNSTNESLISAGLDPVDCENHSSKAPAIGLIAGGATAALIGIPLAVWGGQKVPAEMPRLSFAPQRGGATAGLVFRF